MTTSRVRVNQDNTGIIYTTRDGQEIVIIIPNFSSYGINPSATGPVEGYHTYEQDNKVVRVGDASEATIEENYREEPYPTLGITGGSLLPVTNGQVSNVPLLGSVVHYLVDDTNIIVNVTQEGHRLYPGVVVRELYERDGAYYISSSGIGNGPLGSLNVGLADWVWQGNADRIGRESIYEENQPSPSSAAIPLPPNPQDSTPHGCYQGPNMFFGNGPTSPSPLILDLDGDGVEVSKLGFSSNASYTYFDMTNDGFAERTAWVTGGDGLLVVDTNGNSKIDNQSELFGNGFGFANGFAELKSLDSNNDNIMNSSDTAWSTLRVWVDANENGITESGELKTLSSLGITSFNLNATTLAAGTMNNENTVSHRSTFVINGQARTVDDVWFNVDTLDTYYQSSANLDVRTFFLPTLKGFGVLKDLHVAMSENAALLNLVETFATTWATSKFGTTTLTTDVENILFKWAGVETLYPTSIYGASFGKAYGFMEKFTGVAKPAGYYSTGLGADATIAGILYDGYQSLLETFKAQLILQSGGSSLFTTAPSFNIVTGEVTPGVVSSSAISALSSQATASGNAAAYWKNVVSFLLETKDNVAFTSAEVSAIDLAIKASNPSLSWTGMVADIYDDDIGIHLGAGRFSSGMTSVHIVGGNAGDWLEGGYGDDWLVGQGGDDLITDGNGNDILDGGEGIDTLQGGVGNDTYIYTRGLDTITDTDGTDVLKIKGAYTLSDITLQRDVATSANVNQLNVYVQGVLAVTINNQFLAANRIEKIVLDNGSEISLTPFLDVVGTSGANTLTGLDLALLKSDVLYGLDGNDTLNGGQGNDRLEGGNGDDTYSYVLGGGTDVILDAAGATDKIVLSSTYLSGNVSLVRVGDYDLAIESGGQRLILISNQFLQANSIETLQYGNGTTLNLMAYSHTRTGTSGNDTLYGISYGGGGDIINGLGGNDLISGGNGNDTLNGGDGNDTIFGGDGNDIITGGTGNDVIDAGAGNDVITYDGGLDRYIESDGTADKIIISNAAYTSANMTLYRAGTPYHNDLEIRFNGQTAFTLQGQFTVGGNGFETIQFSNGTTFNLSTVQYTITGTSGDDSLYGISSGGNPNDIINGLDGNDSLLGQAGNDTLNGGNGTDSLSGGIGNDTYKIDLNSGADTIQDDGGTDTILFGTGFNSANLLMERDPSNWNNLKISFSGTVVATVINHFDYNYTDQLLENIQFTGGGSVNVANTLFNLMGNALNNSMTGHNGRDAMYGGDGGDTLYGYGGADALYGENGNDYLYGYLGDDAMDGGAGVDYLYGGDGNDTLQGGADNDALYGENGNDILLAGAGIDYLSGGAGADVFKFTVAGLSGIDQIADYSAAQLDVINLKDILIGYNPVTNLITNFVEMTTSESNTIIKVDRDGEGTTYSFTQVGTINGVTGMTDEAAMVTAGRLVVS